MQGKLTLTTERPSQWDLGSDAAGGCNLISSSTSLSDVQLIFGQLSIGESGSFDMARIPSLRLAFNADAPANRLPAELVVKILMNGAWTEWHELLSLTHIYQHWRDVARGTPQLWADAVASIFRLKVKTNIHSIRCLPTLLSWSEPSPLRLQISSSPAFMPLTLLEDHFTALRPHFSHLCRLAVGVFSTKDVVTMLEEARSGMSRLESLHIKGLMGSTFSDERVPLNDSNLPCLHTLSVPGVFFTTAVALKTLKSVTLYDYSSSHEAFLAALERCPPGLESLTVEKGEHPHWVAEKSTSLQPPLHLPSLRRLKVTIYQRLNALSDFIPGITFPSDVAIDFEWSEGPGDTYALLPKDLTGLYASPFFDTMCLFVSGFSSTVILKCFTGGAERLSVRQYMKRDTVLQDILKEHMSATVAVTELVVHLGFDRSSTGSTPFIDGDSLSTFAWGFPNLHRLELLGQNVRDAKLQMAKAFLDRLAESKSDATVPASAKCLAFAFEVEDQPLEADTRGDRYTDEHRYTVDNQISTMHEQLDKIEEAEEETGSDVLQVV